MGEGAVSRGRVFRERGRVWVTGVKNDAPHAPARWQDPFWCVTALLLVIAVSLRLYDQT